MEMIIWGILFVVFLLAEILTVAYVSIWFAIASLVSFILAMFEVSLEAQCIVFVAVAAVLFFATRPLVKKYVHGKTVSTNADSVIGMEGVVRVPIDNLKSQGRVYVNGLEWAAKSFSGALIERDVKVVVRRIEGVSLIVEPVS